MVDPRNYQILVLSTFVIVGKLWLGFDFSFLIAALIVCAALLTQAVVIGDSQYKSALISALSLVLLLRTDSPLIAVVAALIAISSKRFIRIGRHHVFNPSALALVVVSVGFSEAWLSPGQWGPMGLSVLLIAGAGLLVVTRAQRLDVALAFFIVFATIVIGRGLWLGDPLAIALHQLQNGALVVFAFFMITDPRTTPLTTSGRLLYGTVTAVFATFIQFNFYLSAAPLYALVILAPLVALINVRLLKETNDEKTIVRSRTVNTCSAS